jgi:fumarylacetoacetase
MNSIAQSWISISADSDFSLQNIPFGIIKHHKTQQVSVATRIGDTIVDLSVLANLGAFASINGFDKSTLTNLYLNDFMALGKAVTSVVRLEIIELFKESNKDKNEKYTSAFVKIQDAENLLPVKVGDYTDFYSSIDHATNIGTMIRDPKNALMPNWKYIPVGYHGRASSICVSGHSFHRPKGQQKPADSEFPTFGPCKLLDFELETAYIVGKSTKLGESISTEKADEYIFGMVLFNDWSARDIQTWEYVPLGPFLSKNFASTISPWVVTLDALEPFRTKGYVQEPKVFPYLEYSGNKNVDIKLEVAIKPENSTETVVCNSNYKYMYWTMEQQLAHHTINGCNVNVGDMMGSGTISGPEPHEYGSMMELSWKGTKPLKLNDGSERKFINDYDTVILRGYCQNETMRVGFGECKATVLPAN